MNPNDINKQIETINRGVSQFGLPTLSPITADSLSSSPTVNVPTPVPSQTPAKVIADASTSANPFQSMIDQQSQIAKDAGQEKTGERTAITDLMGRLGLEGQRSAQLQQQSGLPERVQQYSQYTNEINSLTASASKQVQDLYSPNSTLTQAQAQAKAQEINRGTSYEITMKEIARSTAGNDITRLQSSIQNQLDIEFTPLKTELETRKFLYEELKDDFTTAEKRAFELQLETKRNEIETKESDKKSVGDMIQSALENGINLPPSVAERMMRDGTREGALRILSQSGISLQDPLERGIKQAQLNNLREQSAQQSGSSLKPLTATQSQALGYGERTLQASMVIDEVGNKFTGSLSRISGLSLFPTGLKSSDRQRFEQSQRNFINAVLRRESGAAIAPSEFDSAALQYFPQPGDKQAVLIQKKQNRDLVIKNLLREAGVDTTPIDQSLNDPLGLGIINSNPLDL